MCWVVEHFAEMQKARNDLLKQETSVLDKQIDQVKRLRETIQALLARKGAIEDLQRDRNASVLNFVTVSEAVPLQKITINWDGYASGFGIAGKRLLFDELSSKPVSFEEFNLLRAAWERARAIHLSEINVEGNKGLLRGETYSAHLVSRLMRNLDAKGTASKLLLLEAISGGDNNSLAGLKSFTIEYQLPKTVVRHGDPVSAVSDAVNNSQSPRISSNPTIPQSPPEVDSAGSAENTLRLIAILAGCCIVFLIGKHALHRWYRQRQRAAGVPYKNQLPAIFASLQEADHTDPNTWPLRVRLIVMAEVFALALGVSIYVLVPEKLGMLQDAVHDELMLKEGFIDKKKWAAGLELHMTQLDKLDKELGFLLRQLPKDFEVAQLLSELNQAALGRGLNIDRIHPDGDVVLHELYAIQRWSIQLSGSFNDMGKFVADIGNLPRIITLPKYRISLAPGLQKRERPLLLEATLETYRYLNEGEIAMQRQAAQKAKKK